MMRMKTYDEFITSQDPSTNQRDKELFKLQKCPTPGCRGRALRPTYYKGKITGFSCNHGCKYRANRNKISKEVGSYELITYNHYMVGTDVSGHNCSPDGNPLTKWH